jgi:hypothetical protein
MLAKLFTKKYKKCGLLTSFSFLPCYLTSHWVLLLLCSPHP